MARKFRARFGLYCGEHCSKENTSGIIVDGRSTYDAYPVRRSDTQYEIRIREGLRSREYFLAPQFTANYDLIRAEWLKDEIKLPASINADSIFKYSLGKDIKREQAGLYRLNIFYGSNPNSLYFNIRVVVEYPPSLTEITDQYIPQSKSSFIYCIEGSDSEIKMEVENAKELDLLINGYKIKTRGSPKNMWNDWKHEQARLKLTGLDFNFDPVPIFISPKFMITYIASNLTISHTHSVSIVAKNDLGITRISRLIKVVSLPKFLYYPADSNCSNGCLRSESRVFRCQLEHLVWNRILDSGVILSISWFINEELVDSSLSSSNRYMSFFSTSKNNTQLHFKPIPESEEWISLALNQLDNSQILCVVEIFDPFNIPRSLKDYRLYDSRRIVDPKFSVLLSFSEKDATVAVAGLSWMWIVVIVIFVLLIVCALLIGYMCIRRGEGATYLVEAHEIAQGKDPEKELFEKEAFKIYERDDEGEMFLSRSPPNENSANFNSDSDQDVELYDMDPGKFTEEGSFVYKYGQNAAAAAAAANNNPTNQPRRFYSAAPTSNGHYTSR